MVLAPKPQSYYSEDRSVRVAIRPDPEFKLGRTTITLSRRCRGGYRCCWWRYAVNDYAPQQVTISPDGKYVVSFSDQAFVPDAVFPMVIYGNRGHVIKVIAQEQLCAIPEIGRLPAHLDGGGWFEYCKFSFVTLKEVSVLLIKVKRVVVAGVELSDGEMLDRALVSSKNLR